MDKNENHNLSVQGPSPPVSGAAGAFGSLIAWAKASFEVRTKAWSGGGAAARFEWFHSQIAFFHLGIWVISVWVDGCRNPKKNKESIKIIFMKSGGVMELMRETESDCEVSGDWGVEMLNLGDGLIVFIGLNFCVLFWSNCCENVRWVLRIWRKM